MAADMMEICRRAAGEFGTPLYFFDLERIEKKFLEFKSAWEKHFPCVKVAYSYKTNSLKAITAALRKHDAWAEVVSGAEISMALEDGFPAEKIIFNGPAKSRMDILLAMCAGLAINMDSLDELRMMLDIKNRNDNMKPGIGLRLAGAYRGKPSRFGMSAPEYEEAKVILGRNRITPVALHFHMGSNIQSTELHSDMLFQYRDQIGEILAENKEAVIDIGGGFPAKTSGRHSSPITPEIFADEIAKVFDEIGIDRQTLRLVVEPGRCLVEDEGYLVTSVRARKKRNGKSLIVVDAGLHLVNSMRTWAHNIHFTGDDREHTVRHSIYGCNCYESDLLAEDIGGPDNLEIDDLIVIDGVGGYDFSNAGAWTQPAPPVLIHFRGPGLTLARPRQLPHQMRARQANPSMRPIVAKLRVDERIELRALMREMADDLASLVDDNREYLAKWLPWAGCSRNAVDSEDFISSEEQARQLGNRAAFGIWLEGGLAGVIAFHQIDHANRQAAIGYWLAESRQGHGIATNSCRKLVDYGFSELDLFKIVIRCAKDNIPSRAIPERLGFKLEVISPRNELINGQFLDQALYSLTRDEWAESMVRHLVAESIY